MKKFNLVVVIAWLIMFLFSLHSGPAYLGELDEERGVHYLISSIVYGFNETVWANCNWCAEPSEPVRVEVSKSADSEPQYAMQDHYGSSTDNRLTQTILRNTFPALLAFMLALNITFFAGKISGNGRWASAKSLIGVTAKNFLGFTIRRLRRKKEEDKTPNIVQVAEVEI